MKTDFRDATGFDYGLIKEINGKLYRCVVGIKNLKNREYTTCPRWNLVKGKEARKIRKKTI